MSFGISGFGAGQVRAIPQAYQALSFAGAPPTPAKLPFGTANPQALATVEPTTRGLPLETLIRASAQQAAVASVTAATPPPAPLSTAFTGTANVLFTPAPYVPPLPQTPLGVLPSPIGRPVAPISFVPTEPTANQSSVPDLVTQSLDLPVAVPTHHSPPPAPQTNSTAAPNAPPAAAPPTAAPPAAAPPTAAPPTAAPSLPPSGPAHLVKEFLATVRSLAVASVYPHPLFAFSA